MDMIRWIVLMIMILCCGNDGFTQNTFSKRVDLGLLNAVLTNIVCNDTICFVVGIYRNPLTLNTNCTMILEVDKYGEIRDTILLAHDSYSLTAWEKNMRFYGDHKIKFLGSIRTEVPYRPWLVTYDYVNKTVDTITFLNVAGPVGNYVVGRNWFYSDSLLHITYGFSFLNYVGTAIDQYDSEGKFMDRAELIFTDANYNESLLILEDKVILGMRLYTEQPPFKPLYRCGLFSLSKNMTLATEWVSLADSSFFRATDLLKVNIDDYIISTIHVDPFSQKLEPYVPWLLRVNSQTQEILWSINLGLNVESAFNASTALLYNLDSTAVHVAGQQFEKGTPDNPPQTHGFLAKVNMDGQLQWIRRYLGTVDSKGPDHKIFDAELLPDGSIIMVGESTDLFYEEPPGQRGWMLKVDSFGCLVPGCHEPNNILNFESMNLDVRLYPNPIQSGDQLALFLGNDNVIGELKIRLMDLNGILLREYKSIHSESSTYLLDIPGQLSGMYLLNVELENHSWTGQIFIVR